MSQKHRFNKNGRNALLTLAGLGVLALVLYFIDSGDSVKLRQVSALFAIWAVAAVSLNLINGVTGILSLGHHGFMLIGGYITALLILPETNRLRLAESARSRLTDFTINLSVQNWLDRLGLDALTTPETLWLRFLIALFIGGLVAAVFGLIVGFPSLRLRGDYLAIVTFGFGEIIRLLASTDLFAPFHQRRTRLHRHSAGYRHEPLVDLRYLSLYHLCHGEAQVFVLRTRPSRDS